MRSLTAVFLFISVTSFTQSSEKSYSVKLDKDSTASRTLLAKSKLEFHNRSVLMNTVNEGSLKDDYAFATGVGIGITTAPFHGLQIGISSFTTFNLFSSDLTLPDPSTSSVNRYETGLFDVQDLSSKKNLIRIENLFLKYSTSKSSLTVGKMRLNTPFLNPQDGRMNATIEEGCWISVNEWKKIKINAGWIWKISPRSTTHWYSTANTFGIYPSGVGENGRKSDYQGNINSSGVALANIIISPSENLKINLWDMLIENVMNTSMIEINNEFGTKFKYYQGMMFIHQDAINFGGNSDQSKTYINRGNQSNSVSAQIGIKSKKFNTSFNFTHITGHGRYLSPREWGRDPFYTFMPREKNDGLGNVTAMTIKTSLNWLNEKLETGIGYGRYMLPDVKDFRLNKYGMPSYHQVNLNISYSFNKFLKGTVIRFLTAYKFQQGNTFYSPMYIYNKVNMANMNLIIDFRI
jgi:hypothetical protein